jgi:hypothetical protein
MKGFFFAIACLQSFYIFAQTTADSIKKRLHDYQSEIPSEKVYLHLDKPYYIAGDTVWFKAYLVDATHHLFDSTSKVLYVDIAEVKSRKILFHKKVKINSGVSHGEFALPDTIGNVTYQVHAYTNRMRNYPQFISFVKEVRVFGIEPASEGVKKRLEQPVTVSDFQFFPEGGNFVVGLQNRVAFKAINDLGLGIDCEGYVLSDLADTVTTLKSQYLGMGYFLINPSFGRTYHAIVRTNNGIFKRYDLPTPIGYGYIMQVNNLGNAFIKVFISHNFSELDRAILIAHQRSIIMYAGQTTTDGNSFAFVIPKDSVPDDGIVHLTLFTSKGIPQCERIIYINKNNPLQINITTDKNLYGSREKVELEIAVKDSEGKPIEGNFSVSVTDSQQVFPNEFCENIKTWLHLESDVQPIAGFSNEVKGIIERPAYYFDKRNKSAPIYLDLLLMTQGWRRFLWKDVMDDVKSEPVFNYEGGFNIGGQVLSLYGKPLKKPAELSMLYSNKSGEGGFLKGTTTSSGKFLFTDLDMPDSTTLVLQAVGVFGRTDLKIALDSIPENLLKPEFLINPTQVDTLNIAKSVANKLATDSALNLYGNKVEILKTVVIKAKKIMDNRRLNYHPSATIKIDDKICGSAMNVLQFLQSRVAGVNVYRSAMNMSVIIRGKKPVFLVDGFQVDDGYILSIPPCNVEAIDVMNSTSFIYKAPVIAILTKTGNPNFDFKAVETGGQSIHKIMGYNVPKAFYSPMYSSSNANHVVPDLRSTLYWQPIVKTDANGKAKLVFWNSDEKTNFKVSLEGLSNTGKPAAAYKEYSVK